MIIVLGFLPALTAAEESEPRCIVTADLKKLPTNHYDIWTKPTDLSMVTDSRIKSRDTVAA